MGRAVCSSQFPYILILVKRTTGNLCWYATLDKVMTEDSFREEIKQELEKLGLNKQEKNKYVIDVFIDANP